MKTKTAISFLLTAVLLFLPACSRSQRGVALWGARVAVMESLKNPGGSKYRGGTAVARTPEEDLWVVLSTVDAQNDFGALIRVNYLLLMLAPEEGTAECLHSLRIEAEPTEFQVRSVTEELGENWIYLWDDAWEKED